MGLTTERHGTITGVTAVTAATAVPETVSPPKIAPPREIVYIGYMGGLGGEARQMFELAAGVARRGANVTVVVPEMPRLHDFAAEYDECPNLRIELTPLIRFDTFAQSPKDVLQLLWMHRAPLLHLHTGDIAIPRMTLLGLEVVRGPRVVATIHSAYPDMAVGGIRAKHWRFSAAHRMERIFCPSRHGRAAQLEYGVPDARVATIYNGVDVARYASGNGANARRALGLDDSTPLVVFSGRLHPQKRPLDTIDAFAKMAADFPAAHLAMVGTGPLEEETRQRAAASGVAERIHLVGHQTNVPDWLAAADAWIISSDAENFSLSVLEAMAAGLPIVGTLCSGNDEILVDGENALTAPVGDIEALADGLRRLLAESERSARLRAGARRTVARFSMDAMVERYIAAYAGQPLDLDAGRAA
jgi:glycosyltransferase involved in cell wall biosynthesis